MIRFLSIILLLNLCLVLDCYYVLVTLMLIMLCCFHQMAILRATVACKFFPVYMGSAFKNKVNEDLISYVHYSFVSFSFWCEAFARIILLPPSWSIYIFLTELTWS